MGGKWYAMNMLAKLYSIWN